MPGTLRLYRLIPYFQHCASGQMGLADLAPFLCQPGNQAANSVRTLVSKPRSIMAAQHDKRRHRSLSYSISVRSNRVSQPLKIWLRSSGGQLKGSALVCLMTLTGGRRLEGNLGYDSRLVCLELYLRVSMGSYLITWKHGSLADSTTQPI
jgi:hypothetical protein